MAGYVRNDTTDNIATGNTIRAADLDGEYDAVEAAFNAVTGHTHDGTAAEGGPITVTGPAQDIVSTSSALRPKTDDTYDLGTAVYQWKDLYIDGTAYIDALETDSLTVLGGGIDNTPIGQTTPAAGTFTTLDATSVVLDGGSADNLVIGAATPADATFVNVQVNGNLIVDGGVDISPSAHILPTTTNVYDLGSAVYEFRNLYIDGIAYLDRVESGEAILTGGTGENMIFDATNTYSGTLLNATVTSLTSPLAIQYGGTSAGNVVDARTNLGLGSMAIQNSNGVNITGGSLSGVSVSGYATTTSVSNSISSFASTLGSMAYANTSSYTPTSSLGTMAFASTNSYVTTSTYNNLVNQLGTAAYQSTGSFISSSDYSDFVNVTGDSMSGTLRIAMTADIYGLMIDKGASTAAAIYISGSYPKIDMHSTLTGGKNFAFYNDGTRVRIYNYTDATHCWYVDSTGNSYSYGNVTAYSDERMKESIQTISGGLDTVSKLRGVSFSKNGKPGIGVVAQEVQEVIPEVVEEDDEGYLSVAYGNLVGVLIEAVKELKKEVEALKNGKT